MLQIPRGITLSAHACSAVWRVQARDESLYCPDMKMPVAKGDELIVEFSPGREQAAEKFAADLRDRGYRDVTVHEAVAHELGEVVG